MARRKVYTPEFKQQAVRLCCLSWDQGRPAGRD